MGQEASGQVIRRFIGESGMDVVDAAERFRQVAETSRSEV